jgi:hypothetical protein
MILIITYDLRSPNDYHSFYEAIKAQSPNGKWWHYMASTWLLSTSKTPQEVVDAIRSHLDVHDVLFVCELKANYQGWLPKPAWDWINSELQPTTAELVSRMLPTISPMPAAGSSPLPGIDFSHIIAPKITPKK